jgi:hypothetical protein
MYIDYVGFCLILVGSMSDTTFTAGNISDKVNKWRDIGTSEFIIDIIANGAKFDFTEEPNSFWCENRTFTKKEGKFI